MDHMFGQLSASAVSAGAGIGLDGRVHVERQVSKLIGERRSRRSHFPSQLLGDPAWDVVLLLALAGSREHRLSVSTICCSVDAPATTVLRCITNLTEQGILIRRPDPLDKRRKYIELSRESYARVRAYCSGLEVDDAIAA
jgi:DNA-binding MarR family transcriptional regulator